MRQLNLNEMQTVSGGATDPAAFLIGTTLAIIGLSLILDNSYYYPSYASYDYYDYYGPEVIDVYTPVYDEYGYYQGDVVDTYYYY